MRHPAGRSSAFAHGLMHSPPLLSLFSPTPFLCSQGEGEPILEVDAYWHPSNESRYINHVPHRSLANDVFLVKDFGGSRWPAFGKSA